MSETDIVARRDLLASSKALLDLDAANAIVPHGLGGHGRTCLAWCVSEVELLRSDLSRMREALAGFVSSLQPDGPDQRTITVNADELKAALRIARAALSPAAEQK